MVKLGLRLELGLGLELELELGKTVEVRQYTKNSQNASLRCDLSRDNLDYS